MHTHTQRIQIGIWLCALLRDRLNCICAPAVSLSRSRDALEFKMGSTFDFINIVYGVLDEKYTRARALATTANLHDLYEWLLLHFARLIVLLLLWWAFLLFVEKLFIFHCCNGFCGGKRPTDYGSLLQFEHSERIIAHEIKTTTQVQSVNIMIAKGRLFDCSALFCLRLSCLRCCGTLRNSACNQYVMQANW